MTAWLPIDDSRDEIEQALEEIGTGGRLVLSAPTGSGKSTRLPGWCLEAGLGPVMVIEPRRIACRTLAGWVARGLGQEVGGRVGYAVRFDQRSSQRTEILFVTPGMARRYLSEGSLGRFSTIIFDEFHERSWETDTVMAALAESSGPQRLILMSATLAADRLASVYKARRVQSFGRNFPVEVSYRPDGLMSVPSLQNLVPRVVKAVEESWDKQGGTLVFLPGLAAMREVSQRLSRLPVRLLHGSFANQLQDGAFEDGEPRIVLATNVAESSLTVPGITTVIDSGLEKRPIHQAGYVALSTVPIAMSSAEQRAGRAGRTAPGRCLRLWQQSARLEAARPPDLERMELDELLIFLASLPLGLSTPLAWLDRPPAFAWDRARARLLDKGLVDPAGHATALGVRAAKLPVDTGWARLLALAPPELQPDLCDLHCLSASRRSLTLGHADSDQVECRKKELGEEPWRQALSLIRLGHPRRHGLDAEALQEARRLSRELQAALGLGQPGATPSGIPQPGLTSYLAKHWPERHFVRRQTRDAWGNGEVECRTGRGEELPEECLAAVFLQVEPVVARGLKVELVGRWALPTSLSTLRAAGYGTPELSKIRWKEATVIAKVAWTFAGRVLAQVEETLNGKPLRQALLELARRGSWKAGQWESWEEHAFYSELSSGLAGTESAVSAADLFSQHLQRLGIESSEDLQLLSDSDLGPPEGDFQELKKAYPRLYQYGGVSFDVSYQPQRSRLRLSWRSGPKGAKPKSQHLPRWNGWAVELEERGQLFPLRP